MAWSFSLLILLKLGGGSRDILRFRVTYTIADRILGCLRGIATGDAIGKQTEMLSLEDIARWYPDGVRGFEGTPGEIIPRYIGNSKHEWRIGETTDDTERTIAVARAIISDRKVSHVEHRARNARMPQVRASRASSRSGSFTRPAIRQRIATMHDGCGAAIRVSPVGILHAPDSLEALVERCPRSIDLDAWRLSGDRRRRRNRRGCICRHRWSALRSRCSVLPSKRRQSRKAAGRAVLPGVRERDSRRSRRPRCFACHSSQRCGRAMVSRIDPLTIVPLALGLASVMQSAEEAILRRHQRRRRQ